MEKYVLLLPAHTTLLPCCMVLCTWTNSAVLHACTAAEAASHFIAETGIAETFYIYDLGEVARLYATWLAAMPRVQPHYAVKCNPEPVLLELLNALGAGFDCASVAELEAAAAMGVPQSRIIFANPCKRAPDFRCV